VLVVHTVRGDVAAGDLGVCYPHEHVLGGPSGVDDPDLVLDSASAAIKELIFYRQAGGQAIVDMSPVDYGRDVEGLQRISETAGIHVVCVTGHHKEAFAAPWTWDATVEQLAERFIAELTVGIDGTRVRAGVIKAGSSHGRVTPGEEKVFRAAALAHRETGAAISTHTEAGTMGMEQVDLLRSEGVEPGKIILGHVDRKLEWDYHLQLARTGAYLCYDQISKERYAPDSQRVEFILRLVAEGHGRQLLLSGDLARKSYLPSYGTGGGPGLTYILWRFVPWLRTGGLSETAIDDLLVHNPARALAIDNRHM
jgi:5-phospho-D-xylono-1,4-lactonase